MKIEYTGNIETFTDMLKHKMIEKKVKQIDICEKTGWSKSTVSNLLNNRNGNPSIETMLSLVNAIGCKMYIEIE